MATKQFLTLEGLTTYDGLIKEYIGSEIDAITAEDVSYDNTESGLKATDVQDAIDEVNGKAVTGYWDSPSMGQIITYDGVNALIKSNPVALEDLATLDAVDALIGDLPEGYSTVVDYVDSKDSAISAAQDAADTAQAEVDALETYVGTIPQGSSASNVIEYIDDVTLTGYFQGGVPAGILIYGKYVDPDTGKELGYDIQLSDKTLEDLATLAYVGTIPQSAEAEDVVGYIDERIGYVDEKIDDAIEDYGITGYHIKGKQESEYGKIIIRDGIDYDLRISDVSLDDLATKTYVDTHESDENVKQSPTTTDANYEILLSGSADNTEHTEGVKKSNYATFNPDRKAFTFGTRMPNSNVGDYSSVMGERCTASGNDSHAEGRETVASGIYAHAEGFGTTASGDYAPHAEGNSTVASGMYSHAEGDSTVASGRDSHAEGRETVASGFDSHAEGKETVAQRRSQHVFGEYNILDTTGANEAAKGSYIEIVGNGSKDSSTEVITRANARTLDWDGNEVLAGKLTVGTAPTNNMDVATKLYVDTLDNSLAAVAKSGDAEDVSYDNTDSGLTSTDVQGAIDELADASAGGVASKTVYITETAGTSQSAYSKRYGIYQGSTGSSSSPVVGEKLCDIDIPKDMVVESGSVVDITFHDSKLWDGNVDVTEIIKGSGTPTADDAGKYIKLQIANASADVLYIKATDLVDIYTAQQNATQIQLAIDANNVISATVVAGSIGTTELAGSAVTTAKIADDAVTADKIAISAHSESQTAGADGLSLTVTTTDGQVSGVSGAIAANTYDAYGAASAVQTAVIGTASDTASDNTIYGAKAYADDATEDLSDSIIGTSGDTASDNTIYGAKAYADAATAAIATADIQALFA